MRNDNADRRSRRGGTFRCNGVLELTRISHGKALQWGGECARFISNEKLLEHLPRKRDYAGRVPLKVVLNISPERVRRLGFGLTERRWAFVEVYAINAVEATVFCRLLKFLRRGNPWTEGVGYHYPWLNERYY